MVFIQINYILQSDDRLLLAIKKNTHLKLEVLLTSFFRFGSQARLASVVC